MMSMVTTVIYKTSQRKLYQTDRNLMTQVAWACEGAAAEVAMRMGQGRHCMEGQVSIHSAQ